MDGWMDGWMDGVVSGKLLMAIVACYSITITVIYLLTFQTAVIPVIGLCAYIPEKIYSLFVLFICPVCIDIMINSRFIYHVFLTTMKTAGVFRAGHANAPMRLLRITCLMSVSSAIVSLFAALCAILIIPLPDLALITPILCFEQSYHVWSTCWPAIIVRVLKSRPSVFTKMSIPSSKQKALPASSSATSNVLPSRGSLLTPGGGGGI